MSWYSTYYLGFF